MVKTGVEEFIQSISLVSCFDKGSAIHHKSRDGTSAAVQGFYCLPQDFPVLSIQLIKKGIFAFSYNGYMISFPPVLPCITGLLRYSSSVKGCISLTDFSDNFLVNPWYPSLNFGSCMWYTKLRDLHKRCVPRSYTVI